jgi:hypothetical protein
MKNRQIKFKAVLMLQQEDEKIVNIIIPKVTLYDKSNSTLFGCDVDNFDLALSKYGYEYDGEGEFSSKTKPHVTPDGEVLDGDDWIYFDGIPLQLTGLKDRNEKEIWEGDIMKYTHPDGDTLMIVIYNDSTACFDEYNNDTHECEPLYTFDFEENKPSVIGNRYENPELLK